MTEKDVFARGGIIPRPTDEEMPARLWQFNPYPTPPGWEPKPITPEQRERLVKYAVTRDELAAMAQDDAFIEAVFGTNVPFLLKRLKWEAEHTDGLQPE